MIQKKANAIDAKDKAMKIAQLALDKRAENVVILDLRGLTSITDFFVICTGASDTQVKAISTNIENELKKEAIRPWHREGLTSLNWVLLDYIDVVAHVFLPEIRDFYSLERIWGDAEKIEVTDEQLPDDKV